MALPSYLVKREGGSVLTNDFNQAHKIWVGELFHEVDFTHDGSLSNVRAAIHLLWTSPSGFGDELKGIDLHVMCIHRKLDFTKAALSNARDDGI